MKEAALMTFSSHFTVDGLLASLLKVIFSDISTAIFTARFQTQTTMHAHNRSSVSAHHGDLRLHRSLPLFPKIRYLHTRGLVGAEKQKVAVQLRTVPDVANMTALASPWGEVVA